MIIGKHLLKRSCGIAQFTFRTYVSPLETFRVLYSRKVPLIKCTCKKSSKYFVLSLCGLPSVVLPLIKLAKCSSPEKDRVSESALYRESDKKNVNVTSDKDSIPWGEFFKLLRPYLHYLIGAIAVSQPLLFINVYLQYDCFMFVLDCNSCGNCKYSTATKVGGVDKHSCWTKGKPKFHVRSVSSCYETRISLRYPS